MSTNGDKTLFGHPTGLYTLFFAEMWERFSYYGMRALLTFYMIKGFLSYDDDSAYKVYGAYVALVYMTPFFGGMFADRLLGSRRAVVLGGLLMAGGHLLMTIEVEIVFFLALALLIIGNGFFKPNISTMVGAMYGDGDPRRDGGFTIFYMGINLGAAMAPLLCGYVGETYGWHYGFGLATVGMLIGLAVFIVPTRVAQALILGGAFATAVSMVALQDNFLLLMVNGFVAVALIISGIVAFVAIGRGGIDDDIGHPPNPDLLTKPFIGPITNEWAVYIGALLTAPIGAALVWANPRYTLISEEYLKGLTEGGGALLAVASTVLAQFSTPAGLLLSVTGIAAIAFLIREAINSNKIERERLSVVLFLMIFSMLFWAFFEQGGTSIANFADRNVSRVSVERTLTQADVGQVLELELNQAVLGYPQPKGLELIVPEGADETEGADVIEEIEETEDVDGAEEVEDTEEADEAEGVGDAEAAEGGVEAQDDAAVGEITEEGEATEEDGASADGGEATKQEELTEEGEAIAADEAEAAEAEALEPGDAEETEAIADAEEGEAEASDADDGDAADDGEALDPGDTVSEGSPAVAEADGEEEESGPPAIKAGSPINLTWLMAAQDYNDAKVKWPVEKAHVGMGIGGSEIPASTFQSANPIFILIFGLVFTALWSFLAERKLEPNTPVKFGLGLLQLAAGFGAMWYGAQNANALGMVGMEWILLGFLLHTTGELCISPVGLSMVTKLSPARLVSTVMGAWFLALAFSGLLASIIATFTGVAHGGDGENVIPPPLETVNVYGDVFGTVGLMAVAAAVVVFALSPLLKKWMHEDAPMSAGTGH